MQNALNNQVGMLDDMFLWLVANLKQGVIYFIKQALPPNKSAGSVYEEIWQKKNQLKKRKRALPIVQKMSSDQGMDLENTDFHIMFLVT